MENVDAKAVANARSSLVVEDFHRQASSGFKRDNVSLSPWKRATDDAERAEWSKQKKADLTEKLSPAVVRAKTRVCGVAISRDAAKFSTGLRRTCCTHTLAHAHTTATATAWLATGCAGAGRAGTLLGR